MRHTFRNIIIINHSCLPAQHKHVPINWVRATFGRRKAVSFAKNCDAYYFQRVSLCGGALRSFTLNVYFINPFLCIISTLAQCDYVTTSNIQDRKTKFLAILNIFKSYFKRSAQRTKIGWVYSLMRHTDLKRHTRSNRFKKVNIWIKIIFHSKLVSMILIYHHKKIHLSFSGL